MRLTCPSCDAVYEVPDDAIPEEGREVQCTNCGHGWFQPHPEIPVPAGAFAPHPEPEPILAADDPASGDGLGGAPADDPREERSTYRRPPVDPRLRRVLREEAEREVEARRSGREEPRRAPRAGPPPRERIDPPSAAEAGLSPAASWNDEPPRRRGRGAGFAAGFLSVVAIAGLLAAGYVFAAELGEAVPALAEPIAAYAEAVSEARVALDVAAHSAMERLDALIPAPASGG